MAYFSWNDSKTFYALEVVGRGSETQLQVGKKKFMWLGA